MKNTLFTTCAAGAIVLALSGATAFAADMPYANTPLYVPPPPPPLWTGLYGGLNIGGGWSNTSYDFSNPGLALVAATTPNWWGGNGWAGWGNNGNSRGWAWVPTTGGGLAIVPGGPGSSSAGGVVGGGQVGYNYQFGAGGLGFGILVGAEADIQGTSIGDVASLPWFGTVRGRLGYLFTPDSLLYGTAGFAYGGVDAGGYSNTRSGWTAGGGVEWMFTPRWSAKVEYLFVDLDSGGASGGGGWNVGNHIHPQINVVRAGVNYHFNWSAPTPVLAKY
ncbi:MAG: outer membrane beta-barrel protein [Methylocystis sp.]